MVAEGDQITSKTTSGVYILRFYRYCSATVGVDDAHYLSFLSIFKASSHTRGLSIGGLPAFSSLTGQRVRPRFWKIGHGYSNPPCLVVLNECKNLGRNVRIDATVFIDSLWLVLEFYSDIATFGRFSAGTVRSGKYELGRYFPNLITS